MKGAATIEELRRAVVTLQRRDRETRAEVKLLRAVVDDLDWCRPPNDLDRMNGLITPVNVCPTDSTATTPPRADGSRAPARFLSRVFSWFTA
jgi:hypothetical protein